MRIIISDLSEGEVNIAFEKTLADESGANFQAVYERLMVALESVITEVLDKAPATDKKAFREHFYDILDDGFGRLLQKVFPEIDVNEFNLSAAAVVYAQDQIIQKAAEEGKTYHEMLDEYEAIADKYIQEKRGCLTVVPDADPAGPKQ